MYNTRAKLLSFNIETGEAFVEYFSHSKNSDQIWYVKTPYYYRILSNINEFNTAVKNLNYKDYNNDFESFEDLYIFLRNIKNKFDSGVSFGCFNKKQMLSVFSKMDINKLNNILSSLDTYLKKNKTTDAKEIIDTILKVHHVKYTDLEIRAMKIRTLIDTKILCSGVNNVSLYENDENDEIDRFNYFPT